MNPDFEISWNADGNVTFRMGNVALGVGPGTALGYAQDLAKAIQAASRAREVKVMDPSTACMSTVSGAEYIEMRERCYAAEIALEAVERERDEARAAGAAPPSERPATPAEPPHLENFVGLARHLGIKAEAVDGAAADLESLRADRALLRAWGEAVLRWREDSPFGRLDEHRNVVFGRAQDRALALAAQGRGKGDGT